MSAVQIVRVALACDGCGVRLTGEGGRGFGSALEARAAAYSEGWRFPAKLRKRGDDALRGSDVCPECLPNWQQEPVERPGLRAPVTPRRQRAT